MEVSINHAAETREQRGCVVWTGAGFGVELHGEGGSTDQVETFDGAIVGVDVAHDHFRVVLGCFLWAAGTAWVSGQHAGLGVSHGEAMVLRRDPNASLDQIQHRLVRTAVTVPHLVGPQTGSEAHELMPQTDTHDGKAVLHGRRQGSTCIAGSARMSRVAWAVGAKQRVDAVGADEVLKRRFWWAP